MTQPRPGTEVIVRSTGEVKTIEEAPMVTLSEMSILNIAHNVAMAERLVTTLLEREIDYGRTPGTPTDGLWDAGAAKIMAGFNCYVDHQVLFHTDEEDLISWCIQANIISRVTQTIVGTGVGAASTKETKYGKRWLDADTLRQLGYGKDEIDKLPKRGEKYHATNPAYGDLVNTLFQMAAKRAEVDGARSMPGVGGALKKLFEHKIESQPQAEGKKVNPWSPFWGKATQLGLTHDEARALFNVKSMNEWITSGGTVESATEELVVRAAQAKTGQASQEEELAQARTIPERKEDEFSQGAQSLLRFCHEDFGLLPADVFEILHYPNQRAYEEAGVDLPFDSYLKIKAHLAQQPVEEAGPEDIPF